jgi:hypothetical protein
MLCVPPVFAKRKHFLGKALGVSHGPQGINAALENWHKVLKTIGLFPF